MSLDRAQTWTARSGVKRTTTKTGRQFLFFWDTRNSRYCLEMYLNLARMVYNWHQIDQRTWSHSFTFLRQARNHVLMAGFRVSKNGRFSIRGKSMDDNLYLYNVVLTTKAKDRRLRRSVQENGWATQREGMCSRSFSHLTQIILLSRQWQLS